MNNISKSAALAEQVEAVDMYCFFFYTHRVIVVGVW
jgi:hypothetical protein